MTMAAPSACSVAASAASGRPYTAKYAARMQLQINTRAALVIRRPSGIKCMNVSMHDDEAANQQPPSQAHHQLPHGLDAALLPRHVALIPDGHNRWLREKGVPLEAAYEASGNAWKEIVKVSALWGISAFTTYFFSTENWARPQVEVQGILQSYTSLMRTVCKEFVKNNVQACAIGDISCLPLSLQDALQMLEHRTSQNDGLKLSIGMNYGGRHDIVQACRRIVAKARSDQKLQISDINEELLDEEMFTGWLATHVRSPDLFIRTGGKQRLSNFLLWQTSYSELLFLDCLMPDMNEIMYAKALLTYSKRTRTFGRC